MKDLDRIVYLELQKRATNTDTKITTQGFEAVTWRPLVAALTVFFRIWTGNILSGCRALSGKKHLLSVTEHRKICNLGRPFHTPSPNHMSFRLHGNIKEGILLLASIEFCQWTIHVLGFYLKQFSILLGYGYILQITAPLCKTTP